jgi:hypothetical protein
MRKKNREVLDKVGATVDDLYFENEENRETAKIFALYLKDFGDRGFTILTACPDYVDMEELNRMIAESEGFTVEVDENGRNQYIRNDEEEQEEQAE